jgi:hypothetical protein
MAMISGSCDDATNTRTGGLSQKHVRKHKKSTRTETTRNQGTWRLGRRATKRISLQTSKGSFLVPQKVSAHCSAAKLQVDHNE